MRLCLVAVTLGALSLPLPVTAQPSPGSAQQPSSPAQQPGTPSTSPASAQPVTSAPSFAQEPVVLREAKLLMQYNADGTGSRTESQAFTLQSEAAVRTFGIVALAYASATQSAEFLYVRVRHPDGAVVDTPLSEAIDQTPPITQQAPFYSDIKQKQVPVRGLRLGDTVEWQTRILTTKPEAPNQFWGAMPLVRDLVALNQTVELRVPSQSVVNVWTNPANGLAPQKATEGRETVYRWQWRSLDPTVGKEAEAAKKAREGKLLTAEQELDETEGRLPDIAFTTFPDWAAVGAWYRGLEVERTEPTAEIRAKVAEITAGSATEQDKVRAVYDWVASSIRYIGVAFGIGRYQPHAAATVLQNQYGDCKDKHTLLASMLRALGEQPDAVLIGSGVRFNSAVPSPEAFNHLITRLTFAGKPVWLDTTSEVAAYQVLVPTLRDKDALVIPATGTARLERTPAAYPFAPYSTMAVKGTLDKDLTSESDVVYTLHDDTELGLRAALRQLSPAQYSDGVQRMMQYYGFGGTTSDPVIENLNDQEKPLVVRFHYHREHSADWGLNRVSTIFGPTGVPLVDDKKGPTSSILLGTPRIANSVVDMQLPEGWSAELPEAVHQEVKEVRIDTTYHLDGRNLHAERKTTVLHDKVPVGEWKAYGKWYTAASAGDVPYIQLLPPASKHTDGPLLSEVSVSLQTAGKPVQVKPKTEAERLAEAARLVGNANEKLQRNEVDSAEKDLEAAKEFNPNQQELWGDLGAIAARRGKQADALKLYRKEVELYPSSDFAWRNIVSIQARDNLKDAAATEREWVAAAPDKLEPRSSLIHTLTLDQQFGPALAAAKGAEAALPPEVREGNDFQLLLGEAELKGGETAKGVERLSHLIQTDATPLQVNDAVYEMTKSHQQLALAERAQREMLKKLAEQSLNWTGDESPQTMLNTSNLQSAAWDTMGWVLYQEGKYAEAEGYILATWRNRPDAEVGEHLGDVEMALHKEAEASRAYMLADFVSASAPGTSPTLKPKAEAAKRKGPIDLGGKSPGDFLSAMRTFPIAGDIGGATPPTERAVYLLVFTPTRVVHLKAFPGGTTEGQDNKLREARLPALFPPGEMAAQAETVVLLCENKHCSVRPGSR